MFLDTVPDFFGNPSSRKVWTETLRVSVFQDLTNLYISGALSCVLGQSLVDYYKVGNAR